MDFYAFEAQDAVRFSWNIIPCSRLMATRAVMPIGCLYTPMKDLENMALVEYDPLRCKCKCILNPHCQIDYRSKFWVCPFCNTRNPFPAHYAEHISETNLPAELQYSTIEYISTTVPETPNIFVYVVDKCMPPEELAAVKDSIQQTLQLMAPETLVGLVTFDRFTFVHELGFPDCSKSYAFKGAKEYTSAQIHEMLGLSSKNDPRGPQATGNIRRFVAPIGECEATLNAILDDLQPDPWVVPSDERHTRCTGNAMNIAVSLLEACSNTGSRIFLFINGPCTVGPGTVVGTKLEDNIRSFLDLQKETDNCKHFKKAEKFFESIAQRAHEYNQVIDIFAFTLDQFGLMEMRSLAERTGGFILTHESFTSSMFKDSIKKLFEQDQNGDLKIGFSAKINLLVSKDLLVHGAVGPCVSLKSGGPQIAETPIGEGGTTSWYLGGLDRCSTVAFYFDLASQNKDVGLGRLASFQFQTQYKHSNGRIRMRVTTVSRKYSDPNNTFDLVPGFDQEASCVLMARLGVLKSRNEESIEVLKWLDRSLIRLVCRFADYKKDDANSFRLSKEFNLYPQFMYHLRRSHFLQTFGISPDESAYYRATLNRENANNSLVMIQPALLQYTIEQPQPVPVLLDIDSLKASNILLLDTYFNVIIWHGDHIQKWKEAGYQDLPEYENFKTLLNAPLEDAKLIMEDRFPVPRLVICRQGDGNERLLKSKVNPSSTTDINNLTVQSGNYITDDASLKLFMDHLIRLTVNSVN